MADLETRPLQTIPGPAFNEDSPQPISTTRTCADDQDLEDGPLFRATIKQLENKTSALKASTKRILKTAVASVEAQQALMDADTNFLDALRDIPSATPPLTEYMDRTWAILYEQRLRLQQSMRDIILDPLQKRYDYEIKTAEYKRRRFEEASKDYYSYLAKYLSIKPETLSKDKKRTEREQKHIARQSAFDLIRFDYYNFLVDLHGGKKEQEMLFNLVRNQQEESSFYQFISSGVIPHKEALDNVATLMEEAAREQDTFYKERSEKRRTMLTRHNQHVKDMLKTEYIKEQAQLKRTSLRTSANVSDVEENPISTDPGLPEPSQSAGSAENRFKGIHDLENQDRNMLWACGRRKEGVLFSTSKPSKGTAFEKGSNVTWHKYWCVLSGGQLHEYSNWKRHVESHIDPIPLRYATVRQACNADRQFCFEIITPYFRRMYQAISQEEMMSWMATIRNAIESLLNGTGSSVNLIKDHLIKEEETNNDQSPKKGHSRSLSKAIRRGLAERSRWSGFSFTSNSNGSAGHGHIAKNSGAVGQYEFSPSPDATVNTKLLTTLREDRSNVLCADCGERNPEWCSLNLGILLCIECSGIHRSLGTHISKVRSLTLDSASYTPDIVELLRSIGNARSNAVWDPKRCLTTNDDDCLTTDEVDELRRPVPGDTRDFKLKYIQQKYVEKAFVYHTHKDLNTLLFDAIDNDDIPAALYAVALGIDLNRSWPFTSARSSSSDEDGSQNSRNSQDSIPLPTIVLSSGNNLCATNTTGRDKIDDPTVRYPLHYALLYGRRTLPSVMTDRNRLFPMAEFLLQNGADAGIIDPETGNTLASIVGLGSIVEDDAIAYLNLKNAARGQPQIFRASMPIIPSHSFIDATYK
ncbi:hypothetical protein PHYBLDRAFT_173236 [Phycomyces blakesleeanus NRRL 1555(-)]|uniref:ArfGap-domain-containing protein n=1 Tax=Phycomyces blakesleeanus (strain ATCC 8743b / DSM 1359 / FGSC 10004 / NBRC 33097 / NRRL 1555) TaxID=763407 RepID=A0A162ZPE5_PHYB8|nr:hypothetical protein PHYBLDRAFT_173236 [Phycomyces blakesleeanus NRRL 1555(-)]OAD68231.1 hypothetical protein PHYBLDRAFT_173236 [Phycomyces blakesleeanus NRRL 1555(-)]|eukprot:XP_018286271.1 hypothetical protein PHYBLDRAFT_173236 [Phycomyces blakesleeanus NRRL 1555(-)]